MNINGSSKVLVVVSGRRNRLTRVGSKHFNAGTRLGMAVLDPETSSPIVLSKGLSWADCGAAIRNAKSVQARVEVAAKSRAKKSV